MHCFIIYKLAIPSRVQTDENQKMQKMERKIVAGCSLLHGSPDHSAANTKETLQDLKFEALDHPPYSPDFAHSGSALDQEFFGTIKLFDSWT
jgi:hypothetical protein